MRPASEGLREVGCRRAALAERDTRGHSSPLCWWHRVPDWAESILQGVADGLTAGQAVAALGEPALHPLAPEGQAWLNFLAVAPSEEDAPGQGSCVVVFMAVVEVDRGFGFWHQGCVCGEGGEVGWWRGVVEYGGPARGGEAFCWSGIGRLVGLDR